MPPYVVLSALLLLAGCAPGDEGTQPTTGARSESGRDMGPHDPGVPPTMPSQSPALAERAPAPGPGTATRARMDGFGALRFGMSEPQATRAWNAELKRDRTVATGDCVYLMPAPAVGTGTPGFMFEQGRFVRYDVGMSQDVAPGGGRTGMSRAQIESLYAGRVRAQPHKYVPGGHTLRIADDTVRGRAMLFETDARGVVTRWRVGLEPQVDYTEGCS